ncbi:Nif3-like dinuclear metal center hexameric protein [Scatolibacter rhodanostii]|uniref:Nif3-like dinuclear metal center hexameric protein n=1 Tax=Scatolibacter rhodanostii TaxID=2014781 RepID=UPI000C070AA4|nr:Nif3-like dinuclear metal center hexameric protein [Scatolibacter rhodanostii]
MKISEVIAKLEAHHSPLDPSRRTCDGVQYGNPDQECTGVVVTCCPTAAVIQKAAEMGYNFILGHEPAFFDGWDETDWLQDNAVYQAKKQLLDETGIVLYRDHDRVHNEKPDVVFSGLAKQLGWTDYAVDTDGHLGFQYIIPKSTVKDVAAHVAKVMNIDGIRFLGNPDMEVTKVCIAAHFLGSDWDKGQIKFIDSTDCELIIPGEIIDWTLGQYIQDSNALGIKKAVLNVGHFNLEEPGMKSMVEWLPDVFGPDVPVEFVQSGNSFSWLDYKK